MLMGREMTNDEEGMTNDEEGIQKTEDEGISASSFVIHAFTVPRLNSPPSTTSTLPLM